MQFLFNSHRLSFFNAPPARSPVTANAATLLIGAVLLALAFPFAGLLVCGLVFLLPMALVPAYAAVALSHRVATRHSLAR